MALVLYAATAAGLLWLAHRYVMPVSRGAAAALVLLPFCFAGKALLTGGVYAPIDLPYLTEPLQDMRGPLGVPLPHNRVLTDLYSQMIPWRKAVQYALAHHQWPLWNPFVLSGSLLAAGAQPAVYSPFTLLACLLPIPDSLTFTVAINFFIAGLGAFLFARDIGCRPSTAMIASAGFMFSTPVAFFILWAIGGSWAFLPLVLLGARRCVRQPGIASATLLMIALTLLVLAGHPETALHAVFVGGIYGLFELVRVRRDLARGILSAVAAGVIALLLTAIYLLPILDAAPQSGDYQYRRQVWSHQSHGAPGAQSVARIITDFFPFASGRRWNLPGVRDVPLDSAAVGSIVLAAAIYAIVRSRRAETRFFAVMALFGIVARTGWTPLANALQHIPLFDMTITERFSFAAAFSMALLAALGVEELIRRGGDRVAVYAAFATLLFITIGTAWVQRSGIVDVNGFPQWSRYAVFAEIGCLAIFALIVMRPGAAWILAILLVQRFLTAGDIYPTLPRRFAYPPIPILEPLKNIREPFRIVGQHHAFIPGTSALYELEDVRGYEALTLERYTSTYDLWCVGQPVWVNRVYDLKRPFLSFLNVRYAISTDDPPPGWHVVASQRGARLLENERVLPRAFVPNRLVVGRSVGIDTTFAAMQEVTDFREVAWIDAPMRLHDRANGPGTVSIARRPNGFRLQVAMARDGWMVVSEPAWKGWRAYIDGRRVQIQIANYAFLGVYVPAGDHQVRVVYLPDAFVIGRAISVVTLIALIAIASLQRFQFLLQRRDRRIAPLPVGQ
ncbi:MAG: YfhO family protein [Acidobacteriota bacterium]|nr:YfhO family protein [Acidobacteriota bacterium]